jgi:hypothetical protein
MAPRLKISMSSGSKKGTQMYFFFSLKSLGKQDPPSSPTEPLLGEMPLYVAFCISLEKLIKIPLNKKALREKGPSVFPKSESPKEEDTIFQSLLTYISRSPVKEPSFKVPFIESLAQKCPVPKDLHSSFKIPGI